MMKHKWLSPLTLSLLMLGMSQVQAAIQSPVWNVGSANVDVTSMAYELIDLNPEDGIAPAITFLPFNPELSETPTLSLYAMGFSSNGSWSGMNCGDVSCQNIVSNEMMPATGVDLMSLDGSARAGSSSSGMYTGVQVSSEQVVQNMHATEGGGQSLFVESTALRSAGFREQAIQPVVDGTGFSLNPALHLMNGGNDGTFGNLSYFELTPNTQVVFSQQVHASLHIDPQALDSYSYAKQARMQVDATFSSFITRTTATENAFWPTIQDAHEFAQDDLRQTYWSAGFTRIGDDYHAQHFESAPDFQDIIANDLAPDSLQWYDAESLLARTNNRTSVHTQTLVNQSDSNITGVWALYVSTIGEVVVDSQAPIPEPSTYALMALGLLGVAGAARCRKA